MSRVEVKSANDPQYLDMEDLRKKSREELDGIYGEATAPSVGELEGKYDGTVLAGDIPLLDNPASVALANTFWLRWGGKKLDVVSDDLAEGTNWFDLGLTEFDAYPFEGKVVPATFDEGDCYVFDYDIPENTAPVRRVRDEVRKIRNGLYLGRVYIDADDLRFVTYFGLEKSIEL
ncbi:hypothetical protein EGH25_07170 [Haladaptatus sp. F3-133]|uniref:Uncharacterized protein n=1 Tax=Halorutilus salinus TaxID=2487751 RepID=A0A9Q4C4R0_9EURY|nr:hypothetical protein [Halorutilus salinus]MCX2819131.1 hypothetical protein [Halorutilus salinus]